MAFTTGTLRRDDNRQVIQEQLGLPYIGKVFYVDPVNGNDTTNNGSRPTNAFATVGTAFDSTTSGNHDVIVIVPNGPGTGEPYATVETAAITWDHHQTHLIGAASPVLVSPRARVATATASLTPFVTISSQGCIFKNIQFYNSTATGLKLVRISGNRNYFENVHFAGMTHDTQAHNAASEALELYGAQENYFKNCTIAADTASRTGANANLRITLGSDTVARNVFDDCIFPMMADADAPVFIKQGDSVGMDRWNLFRRCQFINCIGSTSTQQTDAITMHATPGGILVLQDCLKIGATGWANNLTNVYLLGDSSNSTYNAGIGFAVNAAA